MRNDVLIAWIRDGLAAAGLSQKDLAPAFGGDPTKVSKVLKGVRALKADEIAPVASILGCPPPVEAIPLPQIPQSADEADRKFDAIKARLTPDQKAAVADLLEKMFPAQKPEAP